jgi:hypothetical protein
MVDTKGNIKFRDQLKTTRNYIRPVLLAMENIKSLVRFANILQDLVFLIHVHGVKGIKSICVLTARVLDI